MFFRSHVWGHFCLRYMNQKLTDNKASLRTFGIKDGDEVPSSLLLIGRSRPPLSSLSRALPSECAHEYAWGSFRFAWVCWWVDLEIIWARFLRCPHHLPLLYR